MIIKKKKKYSISGENCFNFPHSPPPPLQSRSPFSHRDKGRQNKVKKLLFLESQFSPKSKGMRSSIHQVYPHLPSFDSEAQYLHDPIKAKILGSEAPL